MTTKKWVLAAAALGIVLTAAPAAADVQPKIVGGTPAGTDDNPWMMWITDAPDAPEGDTLHCGGTLVTPTKVVTAAHCVDEHPADRMHVVGGRTDLRTDDGEVRGVVSVWKHPGWQHTPPPPGELPRMHPDVAVVTLDRPMPFPALPLATVEDAALYRAGAPARILGWGVTDPDKTYPPDPGEPLPTTSRILQQAQLPITEDEPCLAASESDPYHAVTFDPRQYVCTRYEMGEVTTHGGDSGGPLVAGGKLIGVAAGGTYGLHANYSTFTELITFSEQIQEQLR